MINAEQERVDLLDQFGPLFAPRTVAIVGASTKGTALANIFIRRIQSFGFSGPIYPIHPTAETIEGLPAYSNLRDTPEAIDYAYIAVAAAQVPQLLAQANGHVRYAQVISSGFGESEDGQALEQALVSAARTGGVRVLGPNCMGIYTPRGKITYTEVASSEIGCVGVVSQSGGLGTDIIRRGFVRGVKFSGLVSIGNSADVSAVDLLRFYLADTQTKVIGLYLESSKNGRELFNVLRTARAKKPVIILKGGRTIDGAIAASSHTGSLAGDDRAWNALAKQTGSVLVETLSDFINQLLAFSYLTPRPEKPTQHVVIFGNGGGASVLGTDAFSRMGLRVPRFDHKTLEALGAIQLSPGTSIANPIDAPVGTMQQNDGQVAEQILDAVFSNADPHALVMHLSMPAFSGRTKAEVLENLILAALRSKQRYPKCGHFLLVLRSDGNAEIDQRKREFRERAISLGIPVYDELEEAARCLAAMSGYEKFVGARMLS